MSLAHAIAVADELREELLAEIDRSREERVLLRSFDAVKIHGRLAEREAFLQRVATLQARLRDASSAFPFPPAELDARIAALKALAATLSELTSLNHELARRAADCARAYVHALSPRGSAYDRRGAASAALSATSLSRRA